MGGRTKATRPPNYQSPQIKIEVATRHRVEPLVQGLDGLCALVSALNALRLIMADHAPITKARAKELFATGIEFLHRKNGLHSAVVSGMGKQRRLALTRHLAKQVGTTNCQVLVEQPDHADWTSIADVFQWIDESLELGPVLITLSGGLEHYTVVAKSTPKLFYLFDSNGQRFIRKASCGLGSDSHYQIPPNGLLRLRVHRSG